MSILCLYATRVAADDNVTTLLRDIIDARRLSSNLVANYSTDISFEDRIAPEYYRGSEIVRYADTARTDTAYMVYDERGRAFVSVARVNHGTSDGHTEREYRSIDIWDGKKAYSASLFDPGVNTRHVEAHYRQEPALDARKAQDYLTINGLDLAELLEQNLKLGAPLTIQKDDSGALQLRIPDPKGSDHYEVVLDPKCAYYPTSVKWYRNGVLATEKSSVPKEVTDGVWLPAEGRYERFDTVEGVLKVVLETKFRVSKWEVNLDSISDSVFEMPFEEGDSFIDLTVTPHERYVYENGALRQESEGPDIDKFVAGLSDMVDASDIGPAIERGAASPPSNGTLSNGSEIREEGMLTKYWGLLAVTTGIVLLVVGICVYSQMRSRDL